MKAARVGGFCLSYFKKRFLELINNSKINIAFYHFILLTISPYLYIIILSKIILRMDVVIMFSYSKQFDFTCYIKNIVY